MISIQKAPYDCSFSKNPIEFELKSNMQMVSERVYPFLRLNFSGKLSAGTILSFSFVNPKSYETETINIVAASFPYQPWHFYDDFLFSTLAQYATINSNQLKSIAILNSFYDITTDGDDILLTAKMATEELVFKNVSTTAGAELSITNSELYYEPQQRDGYEMKAIVYMEPVFESGNFERIADLNCFSDGNGIAQLDISGILNSEIERRMGAFPIPTDTFEISNLLYRYYIEVVEYWTGQTDKSRTISKQYHVHWGGMSTDDQRMIEPFKYIQAQQNWLTWWPNNKELIKTQKDWLSWMNTKAMTTYSVVLTITSNGSSTDHIIWTGLLKRWQTLTFSVGYLQKNIESYLAPGTSIQSWSFAIKQGDKPFSEPRTYHLHTSVCKHADVLVWNSYGCPETFAAIDLEQTTEISSQTANVASQFNGNRLMPDAFVFESMHQIVLTARTSFLSTDERLKMNSSINSLICLVWRQKRWIPAVVNVSKKDDDVFQTFVDSMKIELLMANANNRASFADAVPMIVLNESCGIETISVVPNDVDLDVYNNLSIIKDNVFFTTAIWNATTGVYELATAITVNGSYSVSGTLEDVNGNEYPVSEFFVFKQKEIAFHYDYTGAIALGLKSSNSSDEISIDWGIGAGFESYDYYNTTTYITKSISVPGTKTAVLRKPCFNDLIYFESTEIQLGELDLSSMVNLEQIYLANTGWTGKVFLNPLKNLVRFQISGDAITGLEIGICPDLQYIFVDASAMNALAIEELALNIWQFRQFFNNTIGVYITGTGQTPTTLTNDIVNGTGNYVGEGLDSDYGFTFYVD